MSDFFQSSLVVIPAYNEEECVGGSIGRLREAGFQRIRVVDNGSTDQTSKEASMAGAEVLKIDGRGYGLACWTGSLHPPETTEWLVYCNADASDDPPAFQEFAKLAPDHDFLLGARIHPEDQSLMSMPQRFGNWLAPFLIRLVWGFSYRDLGPQRAIRVGSYQKLNMQDRGFGWTLEMQVRAVEENLRIAEIPVRTHPRPAGQPKISGNLRGSFAAGTIILKTLFQLASRRPAVPAP